MKEEKETYRLEMIIFRNFNGTKEEAQKELQEDMEGFDAGEYGWLVKTICQKTLTYIS